MKTRKGQAAAEFLMTYGWAILVVLGAIGALTYFGVLDIASFLPQRCGFPPGFDCIGFAQINASGNTVTFVLANNYGSDVEIQGVRSPDPDDDCEPSSWQGCEGINCPWEPGTFNVSNNEKITLELSCTSIMEGRFKADLLLDFKDQNTGLVV